MYRVLHLSDIHFGAEHAFQQNGVPREGRGFADAICVALDDAGIEREFDAIVVSGDILNHQEPQEVSEARLQFADLRRRLGDAPIATVPGNHDVDWEADPPDKLHVYDRLIRELGAQGLSQDMPIMLKFDEPPLKPLVVCLLDSCRIEDDVQKGLGCVGDPQMDRLVSRLRTDGVDPRTHTMIAVLHHHLLPVAATPVLPRTATAGEGEEPLRISATVDASQLLTRLGELGFAVILHGHQHIGTAVRYGRLNWARPDLHLLAAGSAGALTANLRRQFWVLEFDDEAANVISLVQHGEDAGRFVREGSLCGTLPLTKP
jgi:3',5'-cyclic AMP phosphodiesterase CpdA